MAGYYADSVEYLERDRHRSPMPEFGYGDSQVVLDRSLSTIAPAYGLERDYMRERDTRTSLSIVRPSIPHHHAPTIINEPVIEHEHHHLHHHIDHGDVNGGILTMARVEPSRVRPVQLGREYSYDDLDMRERRYGNGTSITTISRTHNDIEERDRERSRRHRHRHRDRNGQSITRYTRSEVDLNYSSGREDDDLTVIDVPAGTRRVYVNVDKSTSGRERSGSVDWRRERGIRRSRGLGNELWTEITKDLVTREAIEEMGLPYEETEYFYYIFEYLDRDQLAELRELTEDIRHERVRDIEYQSISGSQYQSISGSQYGGGRERDDRTEIIIESSRAGSNRGGSNRGEDRRRRYYRDAY